MNYIFIYIDIIMLPYIDYLYLQIELYNGNNLWELVILKINMEFN